MDRTSYPRFAFLGCAASGWRCLSSHSRGDGSGAMMPDTVGVGKYLDETMRNVNGGELYEEQMVWYGPTL